MSESEQQGQSSGLQEKHRDALAAQARQLVAEDPTANLVGLIMTSEASEAADLVRALEQATGRRIASGEFVGLVSREFALTILRAHAPAALDWLEPKAEGSLPLISATKDGFRLGAVGYEVPER